MKTPLSSLTGRLVTLLVLGPGGFLVLPLVGTAIWQRTESQSAMNTLVALWFLGVLAAMLRYTLYRCRTCGQRFFNTSERHNAFTSKCLNCGSPWSAQG